MRVYRIHFRSEMDRSLGFAFVTSKAAVRKRTERIQPDEDLFYTVDSREISLTKAGLMKALEAWADHPDNG